MYKNPPIQIGLWILYALCLSLLPVFPIHAADDKNLFPPNDQGVTFPDLAQPGNIFVLGDKVQINASVANGTSVDWVITDYQNHKVGSGTTAVTDGKVEISPNATGLGFYLVKITANIDGAAKGEGTTFYAVIPALDNSKMTDARFGVASHFGKNMKADLAPILAKDGVATVRDSADWNGIEKVPGQFDFTVHDFKNRVAEVAKSNINTVFTVCFGNPLHYDDPKIPAFAAAPHTQEQYDAYTALCLAHLKEFGPSVKALEIWNEYNGSFCRGAAAQDRPKYYTEMLKSAYTAIKAARPDVLVLGGALNEIPMPYCEKLFKNGALDYMDGIVVHPYGGTTRGVESHIRELVDLMKKYNHGQAKPIWVTEFGDWDDSTLVRAEAATYLTKTYAMLLDQPEVACAYWYVARDYPDEGFPTMGLVHNDTNPMGRYTPSMNYVAYATMANQLYGATPKGHEVSDLRTEIYHFEKNGQGIWVTWSDADTTSLIFQTNSPIREVNMAGGEQKLMPENGQVTVKVDDQPVYLIADKASDVASVTETPRTDRIVAEAESGFSDQQGGNGWSYLTYTSNGDGSASYDPSKVEPMNSGIKDGDWGYVWKGPGQYFEITAENAQPSAAQGNQLWAVRRWTSAVSGDLHLKGELNRGEKGDGDGFNIYVDGQQVYSKLIPPKGDEKIDQTITVKAGSLVDFAITPGPGTDTSFDATGFKMMILAPAK